MSSAQDLKKIVQNKYADIATQTQKSGCGCGCSKETEYSSFNLDYKNVEGYVAEADLNLGCGIPTEFADIKKGDTVVDLGSGAGNDVFVVRSITGESGKVIGIDMTPEMIERAVQNNSKLGFKNVPDVVVNSVLLTFVINLNSHIV